ncbi:CBL-INTERACTING SERINE/THREONINE-PROTEIN KINASE 25-RELATED [Salix viminalis]|uniref:CBL-INTERACTING SERINE/THREONINE-PROTEIN KINASE 25-RELATED n=1 Tax=Salix viminalis TaxID=40686 RepID=A0A9Q0NQ63_SALVM|nr:CBL-INTERACTING SERINE/THREONINE-PROTEIN KINASE 25-RELATED [Salix viminalis]
MDMIVQKDQELDSCSAVAKPKASSPKFFNAFELISSLSSGFDLSGLFESEKKPGSVFTSKASASAIMEKIGGVAEGLDFKVAKVEDFKVRLQGPCEGKKGEAGGDSGGVRGGTGGCGGGVLQVFRRYLGVCQVLRGRC